MAEIARCFGNDSVREGRDNHKVIRKGGNKMVLQIIALICLSIAVVAASINLAIIIKQDKNFRK